MWLDDQDTMPTDYVPVLINQMAKESVPNKNGNNHTWDLENKEVCYVTVSIYGIK